MKRLFEKLEDTPAEEIRVSGNKRAAQEVSILLSACAVVLLIIFLLS